MKTYIFDFFRRGLVAFGFGPSILGFVYLVLYHQGIVEVVTVREMCLGIFSISVLAFLAGGMNVLYQIERLPLMGAILIHGSVLYAGYLATYLINGWLEHSVMHILAFTGIFLGGYLVIWGIIYTITRRKTKRLNALLSEKRNNGEK
jgi:hypothetical protein